MKPFRWIGMLLFCLIGGQLLAQRTPVPIQAGPPTQQDSTSDSTSKRLEIIHADLLTFDKKDGVGVQKLIGDVQLKQDSTLFFCERAYFYEAENRIEVFAKRLLLVPQLILNKTFLDSGYAAIYAGVTSTYYARTRAGDQNRTSPGLGNRSNHTARTAAHGDPGGRRLR